MFQPNGTSDILFTIYSPPPPPLSESVCPQQWRMSGKKKKRTSQRICGDLLINKTSLIAFRTEIRNTRRPSPRAHSMKPRPHPISDLKTLLKCLEPRKKVKWVGTINVSRFAALRVSLAAAWARHSGEQVVRMKINSSPPPAPPNPPAQTPEWEASYYYRRILNALMIYRTTNGAMGPFFFLLFFFAHKVTTATSQRVSFRENKTLLLDYIKTLKTKQNKTNDFLL